MDNDICGHGEVGCTRKLRSSDCRFELSLMESLVDPDLNVGVERVSDEENEECGGGWEKSKGTGEGSKTASLDRKRGNDDLLSMVLPSRLFGSEGGTSTKFANLGSIGGG